ncbi:MAG: HTTM domain-containing protein, partial [Bacteroidota bacterium]
MAKAGQPKAPANPLTTRWEQWLFAPKDAHGLAIFRIGFGLVMLWEMGYFASLDFPETFIHAPQVNLKYPLLEFVQPLSSGGLWLVIVTLMACCVLIALGKFYRWAMGGFCVGFTYLFLLDTAYYNNHLYLICLLAFLLFFCQADAALTIDKAQAARGPTIPAWNYWVLRGQLFIVYFFGGVAKLNADWLVHLEPVHTMLAYKAKAAPGMAGFLQHEGMAYFIAYGGVAFDLIIGFLLLYRPTRKIGFAGALVFNGLNAWIFDDINIFP